MSLDRVDVKDKTGNVVERGVRHKFRVSKEVSRVKAQNGVFFVETDAIYNGQPATIRFALTDNTNRIVLKPSDFNNLLDSIQEIRYK